MKNTFPSGSLKSQTNEPKNIQQEKRKSSAASSSKISNALLGKIIRIFIILVLLFMLVFVLFSIFKMISGGGNSGNNVGQDPITTSPTVTPTPVDYEPYVPSVYSKDPEVLQIEEDVSVLDAELFRSDIGDPMIKPPNLDYNIRF